MGRGVMQTLRGWGKGGVQEVKIGCIIVRGSVDQGVVIRKGLKHDLGF